MLSEAVLKIDVCRYLEDNWPLDDEDLDKMHKLYRLFALGISDYWVKGTEGHFLHVFTQESENDSRRMTAFILILNMPKNGNGKLFFVFLLYKTVECRLSKFLKFGQLCANI